MKNLTEIIVVISKLEEQVAELIKAQSISDEVKQELTELIKDYGYARFRHGIELVSEITKLASRPEDL